MNSIKQIRNNRAAGALSRENYWAEIQKYLREIKEIADCGLQGGISLHLFEGQVIVEIPLASSHTVKMLLNPEDIRSVPFSVLADGRYEPFHSDIIFELMKKSLVFLDIGANMGYYTLAAGVLNKSISIYSFEPNPNVFLVLEENIILNGLENRIGTFPVALGEAVLRNQELFIPNFTGSGGGSFRNLHPDEGSSLLQNVSIETLDQVFSSQDQAMDLIKIDVEGFELSVLKGGTQSLLRHKPTIVIELLRKWMLPFETSPGMAVDLLSEMGYKCLAIGEKELFPVETIDNDTRETNFVFVHSSRIEHLNYLMSYVS